MITPMTPDINVCVIDFKGIPGHEMVTENEDGSFTILINARLSAEDQLKAYEHAMKHINNDDFQKTDVQTIETIAHGPEEQSAQKERLSEFHQRILAEIQKSGRRIKREMKKIERRNAFLMEYDPEYFDRMAEYNLEKQRLGDI